MLLDALKLLGLSTPFVYAGAIAQWKQLGM